jgi:hypothetical protein
MVTGIAPLPDHSPAQQENAAAADPASAKAKKGGSK